MSERQPLLPGTPLSERAAFKPRRSSSAMSINQSDRFMALGDVPSSPMDGRDAAQFNAAVAEGKGTIVTSTFNLSNAILGSGLLALPYACAHAGVSLFVTLLAMCGLVAFVGLRLILVLCNMTGTTNYEDLGHRAFGPKGTVLISMTILLQNLSGVTSYLVIVVDVMPPVFHRFGVHPDSLLGNSTFLVCMITLLVIFPLCLVREIRWLAPASLFSILAMSSFIVVVIWRHSAEPTLEHAGQVEWGFAPDAQLFFSMSSIAFSFVCHTALMPVASEMHNATVGRMSVVSGVSIISCMTLYLLAALFGYLTFVDDTNGDVLVNYPKSDPHHLVIDIVRLAFAMAIIATIALVMFPARRAMRFILLGTGDARGLLHVLRDVVTRSEGPISRDTGYFYHITVTAAILGGVLGLALTLKNIEVVFGLLGSISAPMLMLIWPCLLYLKVAPGTLFTPKKLLAVCGALLGLSFIIACETGVILHVAKHGISS